MKSFSCLAVAVILLSPLAGCMSAEGYDKLQMQNRNAQDTAAAAVDAASQAKAEAKPKDASGAQDGPAPTLSAVEPRKVVYVATLTISVRDMQSAQNAAKAIADESGGYIQRQTNDLVVLRVPAEKFEPALAAATKLGWVTFRDITSEDVSEKYTDLDIRIKNAKVLRDRLAALLEKNPNHEEVVALEKELSAATTRLEELEGQLNRLKSQVAFATLTLKFQPQPQAVPPEVRVKLPFAWLHTLGLNTLMAFKGQNIY